MERIPHTWIGRINSAKMSVLPKTIYRVNAVSIRIPMIFLKDIEKKIYMKIQNKNKNKNKNSAEGHLGGSVS